MQQNDIATLTAIRNSLVSDRTVECVETVSIVNPAKEVEVSLARFLKHRLSKLEEASDFEEQIKDTLLARLSEATFPQLLGLLEIVQKNNNMATEKVLAPFITANGKGLTETMRDADRGHDSPEERVYADTDNAKVLQSLQALSQLLEIASTKAKAAT